MRKPEFITFTGVDERTDIGRLHELSRCYPVEWGILFSPTNQGKARRYPDLEALDPLMGSPEVGRSVRLSAHICGRYSNEIMRGKLPEITGWLRNSFRRTQVNVADGETFVEDHLVKASMAAEFAEQIGAERAIVQCRGKFPIDMSVDWLYDRSGGRGELQENWNADAYLTSAFCGYAGGMGPDNILDVLTRISITHPADKPYWVDMEGNVRTHEWFDLDKCEAVLRAVYGEGVRG